jgi:hypothetical protein
LARDLSNPAATRSTAFAGEIRATHLDFRYPPIAKPEETGNGGPVRWVAGRPGEAPAYAGTDFTIAQLVQMRRRIMNQLQAVAMAFASHCR